MTQRPRAKSPIRWTGVLFAFAANVLLVTVTDMALNALNAPINAEMFATVIAPLIAGSATALYTRSRGGMHALIGAAIGLPVLVFFVFPLAWPLAIFATLFCVLGAALTELGLRNPLQRR